MKIVETNIVYEGLIFHDHQSRVLEIPSWDEYCDLYRNYDGDRNGENYKCVFNQMIGCVIPKNAKIIDLKFDDRHLTCNMGLYNGTPHYKLAYILEQ